MSLYSAHTYDPHNSRLIIHNMRVSQSLTNPGVCTVWHGQQRLGLDFIAKRRRAARVVRNLLSGGGHVRKHRSPAQKTVRMAAEGCRTRFSARAQSGAAHKTGRALRWTAVCKQRGACALAEPCAGRLHLVPRRPSRSPMKSNASQC